jgi:hypothetical protein
MSGDGGNKGSNNNTYQTSREIGLTTQNIKDQKARDKAIKEAKAQAFQDQRAYDVRRATGKGPPTVQVATNIFEKPLIKGAQYTGNFFTTKVLTSTKAKKNIGYTKEEFDKLSVEKQNEVYSGYMENRMAGKTDAYGNQITTGGDGGGQRQTKTQAQIEAENVAIQKAEQAEKDQAAAEQADAYKKKRLSITSSRSLFARPGGRGFFN